MNESQLESLRNFKIFAEKFLVVRSKSGRPEPFQFNQAQIYLDKRLDAQLTSLGRVRALILKGRQAGCSTYIQGRYFKKVITSRGKKAYILTHEAEATKNLFEITKRYEENLPEGLAPKADRSSAKELRFLQFDSGYSVGTAGNKGAGRSQTIQLFHGSEVAFWPHAEEHAQGVMQAVSNEHGTEIILESTANGIGNYFHQMWQSAMAGESEYQAIFLPWYWQQEYKTLQPGFKCSDEEQNLLDQFSSDGLTIEHMNWRRLKIAAFSSDPDAGRELFQQEYPFTALEAFRNPIDNVFINAKYVVRARSNDVESDSPLIIGVDPAISDKDKSAIIRRKGRKAYGLETFRHHNTMEIAGKLKRIIEQERPHKMYIDCIGIGAGIVDRLQEMGHNCVEGVNVARTANQKERYANIRAELWDEMKGWLYQNELPVQIPDDDELHRSICSLGFKHRSNGQLLLESKDDLRARGMPSCDEADSLMLTFASGMFGPLATTEVYRQPDFERGMFT